MKIDRRLTLVVFFLAALLSGCAGTLQPTPTASTQATETLEDLPALKVALDCGACAVKSTIPHLIVDSYTAAAAKAGRRISATREAQLSITAYTARGDAARFLAGAFAGKDEIKAVVSYQGKTHFVEDYYRNAWLGIETLANNIGEMTYLELK